MLCVDPAYWARSPDPDVSLHNIAADFDEQFELAAGTRELIQAFMRDHSDRRCRFWNGLTR